MDPIKEATPSNDFSWDVFVSQNGRASRLVREIVYQWRALGLKVFFDEDSILPGESILAALERAISASRFVVLMLSRDAFTTRWTALDVVFGEGASRKVIPALLEPIPADQLSPSLRSFNIVDLSNVEFRQERYKTLSAVLLGRQTSLPEMPQVAEYGEGDRSEQVAVTSEAAAASEQMFGIELRLEGNLESFTPEQQSKLLDAIKALLETTDTVRIKNIRRGSIKVTLELTLENAEKLLHRTRAGNLSEFGVVGIVPELNLVAGSAAAEDTLQTADPTGADPELLTRPGKPARIFIGHGHSTAWRDLKDFLADRLRLDWDEFNREAAAGLTTQERLSTMLQSASFAFLVMTGEDEQPDGSQRARENVVHEIGLFQARLGFSRAILLLEDGCSDFSNVAGLTRINFPRGNLLAVSEQIRGVLEREGILRKV